MKLGILSVVVVAQSFLALDVHAQTTTVRVDEVSIEDTPVARSGCSFFGSPVSTGTSTFNITRSCTNKQVDAVATLTFPAGDLTGNVVSGSFNLSSPSTAPLSIAVSTKLPDNQFGVFDWRIGDTCRGEPRGPTLTCQVTALKFDKSTNRAYLDEYLKTQGLDEIDEFSIRIWFNVSTPSDFDASDFTPDDCDGCSCARPASSKSPRAASTVTATKHLTGVAGDSKLATGTFTMRCIPGTPGGPCSTDYTITTPFPGQDWFKITSDLTGLLTGTAPITVTADPGKLIPNSPDEPYSAKFIIGGRCTSCPKTVMLFFDVLPGCTSLRFLDGSIVPSAKRGIDPTEPTIATVLYDFTSLPATQAQLSLRLYDSPDPNKRVLQGASDFILVSKADSQPQKTLIIDPKGITIPKEMAAVYLIATLIDPLGLNPVLAETAPVRMPVVPGLKPTIEVVQVTQTIGNDVPLIAGRQTLVRVYPRQQFALSNLVQGVDATISAVRLDPDGTSTPLSGEVRTLNAKIAAAETPDRNQLNSSLNFALPQEWSDFQHTIEITAELKVPPERPDNPKYANSHPPALATFRSYWSGDRPYRIGYFSLCWMSRTPNRCPTNAISYGTSMLKRVYPIPVRVFSHEGNGVQYYELPFAPPAWAALLTDKNPKKANALKEQLLQWVQHQLDGFLDPPDQIVAWLPFEAAKAGAVNDDGVLGDSDPPYLGGKGRASWIIDYNVLSNNVNLAHEIGHNLGLRHALPRRPEDRTPPAGCGVAASSKPDFPYSNITIQDPGIAALLLPAQLIPNTFFDLMAYCPPAQTWISPFHYLQAFDGLANAYNRSVFGTSGTVLPRKTAGRTTDASDYQLITGSAMQDGSAGQLDPPYRASSIRPGGSSDPDGSHCIRFTGDSGTLSDFCFTPSFISGEEQPLDQGYFAWKIPYMAGTTGISLVLKSGGGEHVLTSATSAGAPSISIQTPQPGDALSGKQTITWTASDPGGAKLTYRVQVSNDGGLAWYPLSNNLQDSQFAFDTSLLLGGAQTYLRVVAMNGVDSTIATLGPLTVKVNPQLSVTASSIDFGNVTIGVGSTQTLTLTNSGTGLLPVTQIISDNAVFLAPDGPLYVAPDLPSDLPIDFQPGATGAQQGTITINGSATVTVKGVAFDHPVPNILVASVALDFGSVQAGQTKDLTLAIGNSGSGPLTVPSATSSDSRFRIASPALPFTVDPGASANVTVHFSPNAAGAVNAALVIASNDPSLAKISVNVSGVGTAPTTVATIDVAPVSLDFGTVTASQSKDLAVTITNKGTSSLVVSALSVGGSVFRVVSPQTPLTLAPGASQPVTVRFTPATTGAQTAALTINSNDPGKPVITVSLAGTGAPISTSAVIDVLPVSLDYGTVSVGQNKDLNVSVMNKGTAALVVSISSGNLQFAPLFNGLTLPPGVNSTVPVRFTPSGVGAQNGNLILVSNDPRTPRLTLPAKGTGAGATGTGQVTLQVDGGTFNGGLGFPDGADPAVFVNRLTPPSYPATLKNVQIYFGNRTNGLNAGAPIVVVAATNPSGSANFSALSAGVLHLVPATIASTGTFSTYTVPDTTITSGDFVVGFLVSPNPAGVYPADLDQVTPSKKKSYLSSDGFTFTVVDTYGASTTGNLGIRATVTIAGGK